MHLLFLLLLLVLHVDLSLESVKSLVRDLLARLAVIHAHCLALCVFRMLLQLLLGLVCLDVAELLSLPLLARDLVSFTLLGVPVAHCVEDVRELHEADEAEVD